MEVSGQIHAPAALYPRTVHFEEEGGRYQSQSERGEEKKGSS